VLTREVFVEVSFAGGVTAGVTAEDSCFPKGARVTRSDVTRTFWSPICNQKVRPVFSRTFTVSERVTPACGFVRFRSLLPLQRPHQLPSDLQMFCSHASRSYSCNELEPCEGFRSPGVLLS
jgi:hypothetical protein